MRRWVIADTHFGHEMLVEKGYRPEGFSGLIAQNWHRLVAQEDLVIHLGDLAIPDKDLATQAVILGLPGQKILVMGNHDNRSATWYMKRGFALACDAFELGGVLFTHEPRAIVPSYIRYNVHGHLHAGTHREGGEDPKHRLVSMEELNYMPVQLDRIAK